ncbi:zinc-alpha-2-glycoprotein-like isoform X2 [Aquarana catesbeiana]|uniref:zinc-alpha-2-glycoprotein-like isoform X2 n=1 Tax=Aquarana catesbeiana TaxID=8400 RepID=UPI003CCA1ED9
MTTTFDDGIKLSIPETAGRSIRSCYLQPDEETLEDVFVLCPEEPPESLKSHDDCLQAYQPRPMESCSVDKCVQCPEESPEPVTSYDGGLRMLKPKYKVIRSLLTVYLGIISKIYLRFIQSKTQFKLDFGHHSQYNKRPRKKPARKLFSISSYGILKKSDSSSRDLLPAVYLSSSLILKVMLTSLFQSVVSETQSLMYYHTGVYQQDKCPFKFEAVGFVNDQQIDKYDHDRKCDVPVASWMEKHEDESYWDRETNYRRGWEKVFEDNLRILKHRLNDSSVFLTLQLMYGCKRNKDGSVRGHYQYALNGRDFLYLDDKSSLWTPVLYEAQISADRWNSDPIIAKSVIGYLTQHCTNALQKYISLGEPELNKRVPPEVKVWSHHQSDGITRLQCLVYGFHPRPVDVKWVRNWGGDVPSDEMSPVLPHPDGTYQIRISVEVPTREVDTYSCHVDHSSLKETLTVKWEPTKYDVKVRLVLLSSSFISILILIFCIRMGIHLSA